MLNNSLGNWFTLNELGFLSAFCPSRVLRADYRCDRSFDLAHANPPNPRPIFLSSDHNQCFVQVQSAGQSFLQTAHIASVHLDSRARAARSPLARC
jgi:hypothetical protein